MATYTLTIQTDSKEELEHLLWQGSFVSTSPETPTTSDNLSRAKPPLKTKAAKGPQSTLIETKEKAEKEDQLESLEEKSDVCGGVAGLSVDKKETSTVTKEECDERLMLLAREKGRNAVTEILNKLKAIKPDGRLGITGIKPEQYDEALRLTNIALSERPS